MFLIHCCCWSTSVCFLKHYGCVWIPDLGEEKENKNGKVRWSNHLRLSDHLPFSCPFPSLNPGSKHSLWVLTSHSNRETPQNQLPGERNASTSVVNFINGHLYSNSQEANFSLSTLMHILFLPLVLSYH